jgi:outer membrane protein assembly factor BamB
MEQREQGGDALLAATMTAPVIGPGGILHVGTSDGFVLAIDPDGSERWSFRIPDGYPTEILDGSGYEPRGFFDFNIGVSPTVDHDGNTYVGTAGHLNDKRIYSLDTNGQLRWTFPDGDVLNSAISVIRIGPNGRLYFSTEGAVHSLEMNGSDHLERRVEGATGSPVISPDGTLFICSGNGLDALTLDLESLWSFAVGVSDDPVDQFCHPTVDPRDGSVYFHSKRDQTIYALEPDGALRWSYSTPLWSEGPLTIGPDGTVYVPMAELEGMEDPGCDHRDSSGGILLALGGDGTEQWSFRVPAYLMWSFATDGGLEECYDTSGAIDAKPLVGADGTIYIGTDATRVVALAPDGTPLWDFAYPGVDEVDSSPVIGPDGTLYVVPLGNAGGLFAIGGPTDTTWETTCVMVEPEATTYGERCGTPSHCSSGVWVAGCCSDGRCTH